MSMFKAICLAVLGRMGRTHKPAAQVAPPQSPTKEWLGAMQDHGEILDDLVAPAADPSEWDAVR